MIFKCKMCGGSLEVSEGMTVCECEYCGTKQTLPAFDNEKKINLFNRANRLRFKCEFDSADGIYQNIVSEFPNEAEAYWGLCLCKYGIEYVEDPATGNKVPTCHRTTYESILNDSDYLSALKNADGVARYVYQSEAKAIDSLQQKILSVVKDEKPYDVFICYKETDADKQRTPDSVMAQDIYDSLTDKGLKVFFSRITLEDKLGVDYEPYIFAALNSAKVMLVVATCPDHIEAVWVKNEWSRFAKLAATDKNKTLIPCYSGFDPAELPAALASRQAQDMDKLGAMQDLVRGVEKICNHKKVLSKSLSYEDSDIDSLLRKIDFLVKSKSWEEADDVCKKALNNYDNCAELYYYMFLIDLKACSEENLNNAIYKQSISDNISFNKALQSADDIFKTKLNSILLQYDEISKRSSLFIQNASVLDDGTLTKYLGDNTEVEIPNYITSIGANAFSNRKNLLNVSIPESVKDIGNYAFLGCTGLKKIIIPKGVKYIGDNSFQDCSNLEKIILSNTVESIGKQAFQSCNSLLEIEIPESVTYMGKEVFNNCTNLSVINIYSTTGAEFGDDVFNGCSCDIDYINPKRRDKHGCYVATCVYGSYDCPEVWTLRRYRDYSLAKTWYGRAFIRIYYAISPTAVKWFGETNWFKKLWRRRLDKMVNKLQSKGFEDTPYKDKNW